jgi:repressor LexA
MLLLPQGFDLSTLGCIMTKLTKRQQEIFNLIQSHIRATGSPPTRAEIAKTMGFRSPNAAEDHLRALARKGVIELVPGTSRGIRLAQEAGIPIISRVQGKAGILSSEHIEGHATHIDRTLFQPNIDFLFRVSGNQNQAQGILNGDYLAIHQTNTVKQNQLALLRIHNEISVRPFSSDIQSQHPIVEGLVVGVIRSFSNSQLS